MPEDPQMSNWEYCSIWTNYKSGFTDYWLNVGEFFFETWTSTTNTEPTKLSGNLFNKIVQLGAEGWELHEFRTQKVKMGEDSSSFKTYDYLLFRKPTLGSSPMTKWEYCRVHPQKVSSGLLSDKWKIVIEYWKPDGQNHLQDASISNIHSTAAKLAQEGWEIVKWDPPKFEHNLSERTGDILMKRATKPS